MPASSSQETPRRKRHVPVKNASHIYWSETARGKVFEVRHPRNAEGRRPFEVVGPRLDAAKARAREIHGGTAPPVNSVGMTVEQLLVRYRATHELSADEGRILKLHIEPRWSRTKLREITWSDVAAWWPSLKRQDGKEGPLAEGTKRLVLARFSGLLEYAIEIGALSLNPVKQIPRKRRPKQGEARRRILTPDEEQRLLAYCGSRPWLAEIIVVALSQGLRLGEVLGLQVPEVDEALRTGKLRVRFSLDRDGQLGGTKHTKLTGRRDPRDVSPIDLMPTAHRDLAPGE